MARTPTLASTNSLPHTLDRFHATLEACTIPAADGARAIDGEACAIALSEATAALHNALGDAYAALLPRSPSGAKRLLVGGSGADATLVAALDSALRATAWPVGRHNEAQAGGWPHRWQPGDVIPADTLARVESARKLLQLNAPPTNSLVSASPYQWKPDDRGMELLKAICGSPCAIRRQVAYDRAGGGGGHKTYGTRLDLLLKHDLVREIESGGLVGTDKGNTLAKSLETP